MEFLTFRNHIRLHLSQTKHCSLVLTRFLKWQYCSSTNINTRTCQKNTFMRTLWLNMRAFHDADRARDVVMMCVSTVLYTHTPQFVNGGRRGAATEK
jgi:hypothetical protein